jgi:predicted DNA-binding antitoxin AbrB/MazE fold protein
MTMTVRAVYEGGVLRPAQPLQLKEGEAVDVTIESVPAAPQLSDEELIRRIGACQSYSEWKDLMDQQPLDDGSYDIITALDENRRWSGERPLIPREGDPQW